MIKKDLRFCNSIKKTLEKIFIQPDLLNGCYYVKISEYEKIDKKIRDYLLK